MPANIPTGNTGNISFGPAIVYMDPYTPPNGATPSTDVGFIADTVEWAMAREPLDVVAGSQQTLQKKFARREAARVAFRGLEYNLDLFVQALGTGTTQTETHGGTSYTSLYFGGETDVDFVSIMLQHERPDGKKEVWDIWKAAPSPEFTITLGPDIHQFPYVFDAVDVPVGWGGQTFPDSGLGRLGRKRGEN